MNVNDFMAKHGITDADLDRMAAPYEDGSFEPEPDGKVFSGSHLDAVGTRRVTVVYDAKDTQRVAMIARSKGVKPSSVQISARRARPRPSTSPISLWRFCSSLRPSRK
mgnify:CR=1 FL=1